MKIISTVIPAIQYMTYYNTKKSNYIDQTHLLHNTSQ